MEVKESHSPAEIIVKLAYVKLLVCLIICNRSIRDVNNEQNSVAVRLKLDADYN
jgi:hypothetical protein